MALTDATTPQQQFFGHASPSLGITLSSAAPIARAHACGMRTIGEKFFTPYAPRFVTVNVPVSTYAKAGSIKQHELSKCRTECAKATSQTVVRSSARAPTICVVRYATNSERNECHRRPTPTYGRKSLRKSSNPPTTSLLVPFPKFRCHALLWCQMRQHLVRLELLRLRRASQGLHIIGYSLQPSATDVLYHGCDQPIPNSDHNVDVERVVLSNKCVLPGGVHLRPSFKGKASRHGCTTKEQCQKLVVTL